MAIDFPTSPTVGQQYTFGGVTYVFTAQSVWATAGASAIASASTGAAPQGRLTLQSATPVMTTTQAAKTMLFYTPYMGNQLLPIYDGTNMVMTSFTELSVATTDTTKNPAAVGASQVLDWFIWSDAGTLRISHGPAWTSDIVRSAGTALVMVNGIWLNNASITNGPAAQRGTYVGTTRSNASSQLDWIYGAQGAPPTAGFFGVWNMYNRRHVASQTGDATTSWSYGSTTVRAANAQNATRHSFVSGIAEDAFEASYLSENGQNATSARTGVCYDVTNAFSGLIGEHYSTGTFLTIPSAYATTALGFHFFQAGEAAITATPNFYGGVSQTGIKFNGWM